MKVKATNKFNELNVRPEELNKIPKEGEIFEVTEERFKVLTGENRFKEIFVEEVIEIPGDKEQKDKEQKDEKNKNEEVKKDDKNPEEEKKEAKPEEQKEKKNNK
jgi:hypothetical protein